MAKTNRLWCWRCQADVLVFEDAAEHYAAIMELKHLRGRDGLSLDEATARRPDLKGVDHHVASRFGPPCEKCGKPLRSPRAKHCAECGASV